MELPFSEIQFLDLFAAFNEAFWPVLLALWFATLAGVVLLLRGRTRAGIISAIAAIHWGWAGAAYHALYFTTINPAAWLFAILFLTEAAAFVWFGFVRCRLRFEWHGSARQLVGAAFLVYSLLYPELVLLGGHELPRAPMFGVPCPTTIFTTGVLLVAVPPVPRWLFIIPIVWSLIAGSAAWLFGVTPDLMLFVAAVCLAWWGFGRRTSAAIGPRSTPESARSIDRFMPNPDVRERHEIVIQAPAATVFETARNVDLLSVPVVRAMFVWRARIMRATPVPAAWPRGLVEGLKDIGWGVLTETAGREIVLGSATQPWKPNAKFSAVAPDDFQRFREADLVKIVTTIEAEALGPALTRLRTETRARATDADARRKFLSYWRLVVPGIVLIRRRLVRAVRREAERRHQGGSIDDRSFYRRWVLANGWAEAAGLGTTLLIGRAVAPALAGATSVVAIVGVALAAVLLGIFLEGVVVGFAQGRILCLRVARIGRRAWIVASAAGAGAAWVIGMVPSTAMALMSSGVTAEPTPQAEPTAIVVLALAAALGFVTGPILGFAQWLVLRRSVGRAGRWLIANAVAWGAGMPVIFFGMDLVPWSNPAPVVAAAVYLVCGAAGLVVGAIHGRVLLALTRTGVAIPPKHAAAA